MTSSFRKLRNELVRGLIFALRDRRMVSLLLKKDFYWALAKLSASFRKAAQRCTDAYVRRLNADMVTSINGRPFRHRVRDLETIWELTRECDYALRKDYEPRQGECVIDAGAAVGEYTVLASSAVGPSGKVIAIEASAEPFEYLAKNAKTFKNVIAFRAALSGNEGKLKLFRPAGTAFVDSVHKSWDGPTVGYTVNAVTVDGLVKKLKLQNVDVLKLDIEGAERMALAGAKRTLAVMKPRIMMETHGADVHRQCVALLRKSGYRIDIERIKTREPFIALVYASAKTRTD
ncbi:MAG: FkbM family methyltransferase [Candidatus Aenigmatarchaeota archaeon]|nr:MAG: FkbM family methyltransferase [Candidatus Aenigmarchaeota archaeon]